MVVVAVHHPLVALQVRLEEIPAFRESLLLVSHSVALDVAFIHDIESVFVAEVKPNGIVGIMARPYCINVKRLENPDIAQHLFPRNIVAIVGREFVAVDAFDENWLSVDEQLGFLNLDRAEAETKGCAFGNDALLVLRDHLQGIQIRRFSRP